MTERTTPSSGPTSVGPTPARQLASLWPTGIQSLGVQLADGGYHEATGSDPALMPPAIAAHAIAALTRRGDVVLDPDCGAGTTIVEALRAGRHAIGLTAQRRWWRLARRNVTATKARGAFVDGMVLVLDRRPDTVAADETAGLTGRIDLLLTTFRSAGPVGDPTDGLDRLRTLLSECRPLIRPGGHMVITVEPQRHPTRFDLLDLPGQILTIGSAAGLAPIARCVALTADVQGRRVSTHATLAQRRTASSIERATGYPGAAADSAPPSRGPPVIVCRPRGVSVQPSTSSVAGHRRIVRPVVPMPFGDLPIRSDLGTGPPSPTSQ
jgi:modification methylase